MGSIPYFNIAVIYGDVNRLLGFASDDQVVKTSEGEFWGKKASHVSTSYQTSQGRFGSDMAPSRTGYRSSTEDAATNYKSITRAQRVGFRLQVVIEKVHVNTSAPYVKSAHPLGNRAGLYLSTG